MPNKTLFLFSGQGSQFFQMGYDLYATEPEFRRQMDWFDTLYHTQTGRSMVASLYGAQTQEFPLDELSLSHPAIVMVECALAMTLIRDGIRPDLTLGCSLGAFSAAAIAGQISVEDALFLAILQAEAVEKKCNQGSMIAVLASPELYEEAIIAMEGVIAARNFSSHFVVTTPYPNTEHVKKFFRQKNVSVQPLPVRYPFHSPWLEPARAAFLANVPSGIERKIHRPLWCCASCDQLEILTEDYFWRVVREPILFARSIAQCEQQGPWNYIDLGPSGTLATFLKYLLPADSPSVVMPTITRFGRDQKNLLALRAVYGR